MILDVIILVASLGVILGACIVFTNGVEFVGHRFRLHQGAVGSILAAVGTGMPETVIPIIAILCYRSKASHDVGMGAIVGAPFMLSTLAMFMTGAAVFVYAALKRRTLKFRIHAEGLQYDMVCFLTMYAVALACTFVREIVWLRYSVAITLMLSYGMYVRHILKMEHHGMEDLEPLMLARILRVTPKGRWSILQVVLSLGIIVGGAHYFVGAVTSVSAALGMPAMILSVLITPIATELPEKLNSIIWVGKGKDVLALGNITGALVFQSSFPVVFGMLFTTWELRGATLLAGALALMSGLWMLLWLRLRRSMSPWTLLAGGAFYAVFIAYVAYGGR